MKKDKNKKEPSLYIIGTPIGNLNDTSFRVIDTLQKIDTLYCEDTRITKKLLSHFDIHDISLVRADIYRSEKVLEDLIYRLNNGESCGLVVDAGTPGISDPGGRIVGMIRERMSHIPVISVPGPSAITTAISISGFVVDEFVFLGFPPHKKGRKKFFEDMRKYEDITTVIYESPHRLLKTLFALLELFPYRRVAICRELTKIHEGVVIGTVKDVYERYDNGSEIIRGEFVVILE